MKKKIKSRNINHDRGRCKHGIFIKGGSTRNMPLWGDPKPNKTPINKDNSIWGMNSTGCGSGWTIRIPSIKKSRRTWLNFYRLFPSIHKLVNEHKHRQVNGIVTISDRFGSNHRTDNHEPIWSKRTIKFRII